MKVFVLFWFAFLLFCQPLVVNDEFNLNLQKFDEAYGRFLYDYCQWTIGEPLPVNSEGKAMCRVKLTQFDYELYLKSRKAAKKFYDLKERE